MTIDRTLLRRSWQSWIAADTGVVGPYWLQLLWTGLFSAALALGFTALGVALRANTLQDWLRADRWFFWLGKNLVASLVVGYVIHGMFELVGRLVGGPAKIHRFTATQRVLFYAGIPIVSIGAGWPLGYWLAGGAVHTGGEVGPILTAAALGLGVTFVTYHWFGAKARAIDAERRGAEAQLRLLQGQMEPHFLFNTLANVHSLIEHDPAQARTMLAAFTDYLRASLGKLRRDEVTLGEELQLVEAYLRVQAVRMEGRLAYCIEADEPLRRAGVLPLSLQPLVENAVQHGLAPKVDGGRIVVHARTEGDTLIVEVHDDGLGLEATTASPRRGTGVALANLRQRLATRFGEAAGLTLAASPPGTSATLRLPLRTAALGAEGAAPGMADTGAEGAPR